MTNRRQFVALWLATGVATQTPFVRAQVPASALRRVGVLAPSTAAKEGALLKLFFDEMRQLGWVEGQNIAYDRVFADDQHEALPRLAAELVARKPEVIFAPPTGAALAAKLATQTIPIVFGFVYDPVGIGLVTSLARPGGNVTGVVTFSESLAPKRIELLREILPAAKRLALLGDTNDASVKATAQRLAPLASATGLTISIATASNPAELDAVLGRLLADRLDAIFADGAATLFTNLRGRAIDWATQQRIPVIGLIALHAEAGALFSFGTSFGVRLRRSAQLVDKTLKGAKPSDMPVEQATLFELVINLKTAKALGTKIPKPYCCAPTG